MPVRKVKGSWWVDFGWRGERYRVRSPINTRAAAQEYESNLRQELLKCGSIEQLVPKPATPTFSEFSARWMAEYVETNNKWSERKNKATVLRAHLVPAFGAMTIDRIATAEIERYKAAGVARGLAPKTINNHLIILRRCLATALEWDLLAQLPKVKPLRVPPQGFRHLSPEEIARIRDAADEPWRTMIIVAAHTGVRFSELIAFDWSDVDLSAARITVRRGCVRGVFDSPKSNRVRHLRLTSEALDALRRLPHREGLVFLHGGRVIFDNTSRRHLREACIRAGIAPIGWHVLRHSFASELVQRGAPIYSVKNLLGHQSVEVTMRYAHLGQENLDGTVLMLEGSKKNASSERQPGL